MRNAHLSLPVTPGPWFSLLGTRKNVPCLRRGLAHVEPLAPSMSPQGRTIPDFHEHLGCSSRVGEGSGLPQPPGQVGQLQPRSPLASPRAPEGGGKSNVSINEGLFVDGIILGFLKYPRRRNPNLKRFPVDQQQRTKPKVGRRGRACLGNTGAAVCTAHARGASGSEKDPVF